jgi:hypothetical protein
MVETVDWQKWAQMPAWKIWQACFLLWGSDPDGQVGPEQFEPKAATGELGEMFLWSHRPPKAVMEFYELLKSHAMAGTLPLAAPHAAPEQFPDTYV